MLVNMKEMLQEVCRKGVAVGGFNCATLESARAALAAAEALGVPVILQHAPAHEAYIPMELAGRIMLALAQSAKVPVCVHLDHGSDFAYCIRAMRVGYTSVMYDASSKPYEQNLEETRQLTALAHQMNITVEAELGNMPNNLKGDLREYTPEDYYTDPSKAGEFAEKTGVDALAISFGTVHGVYKTTPKLSFDVVRRVRESTGELPLVMHGGSGLSDDDYRKAVAAGIRKINYYTYEALAGGRGVYEIVKEKPEGLQFHDVAVRAGQVMEAEVTRVLKIFNGLS